MSGRKQAPRWVHDATFQPLRGKRPDLARRIAAIHGREPERPSEPTRHGPITDVIFTSKNEDEK